MNAANGFRKSDINVQNLDAFFLQEPTIETRNSFSINHIPSFDVDYSRASLSRNCIPLQILSPFNKTSKKIDKAVKDKLSLIQQKLAKAKQQLAKVNGKVKGQQNAHQKSYCQLHQQRIIQNYQTSYSSIKKNPEMSNIYLQKLTNVMPKPKNIVPNLVNTYTTSKNNRYYVSQAVRAINQKNSMAVEHIQSSIQIFNYCALMFYQIQQEAKKQSKIYLPCNPSLVKHKTLVLDLDQTLIHSTQNTQLQPDLSLKVEMDDTYQTIDLNIRPYALTFLKKISKKWEIVVFTASTQSYANPILDQIDPQNTIFRHRLYRQHCTRVGDFYIKDLSRLNRDLKNVVLVDNAAYSYILQLSNGIPILPFYDGNDFELAALERYLEKLENCSDVREANKEYFKLYRYANFPNAKQLIQKLYAQGKSQAPI